MFPSFVLFAKRATLSGYQQWKQAQKKTVTKRWNTKQVSKQAKKVQNHLIEKWKIYSGDKVMVIEGRDKGQVGTVKEVFRKENRLIVEGVNLVKKHVKRSEGVAGGVISKEAPIHYSNVNIVDSVTGAAVRIGMKFLDDGTKVRVTRGRLASGTIVPRPDIATQGRKPRSTKVGSLDTTWQDALRNTYAPSPGSVPEREGSFTAV